MGRSKGSAHCSAVVGGLDLIYTTRYGPLSRPTSSSYGGLRPSAESFLGPSGKIRPYYAVLANFRPFLVSSSNLGNF